MQQGESSSDEMYEEVEEVVRTMCGHNFGHKVKKQIIRKKVQEAQGPISDSHGVGASLER